MKNKIIFAFASVALVLLITAPFIFLNNNKEESELIGGDKDDHGCLVAAGYQFCPTTDKCQRMWEEYCEDFKEDFKIFNFEDCVIAGNLVMESYPRQCMANGNTFVESLDLADSCGIPGANWLEEHDECEYSPKDWCESANGEFHECESACRHQENPEHICTMQCVPVCKFAKDVELNLEDLILEDDDLSDSLEINVLDN